jgi:hypothetical protein
MQHRRGGGGEPTAMVLKKDGTKISLSRPGENVECPRENWFLGLQCIKEIWV